MVHLPMPSKHGFYGYLSPSELSRDQRYTFSVTCADVNTLTTTKMAKPLLALTCISNIMHWALQWGAEVSGQSSEKHNLSPCQVINSSPSRGEAVTALYLAVGFTLWWHQSGLSTWGCMNTDLTASPQSSQ
jgi:hypothetical protein